VGEQMGSSGSLRTASRSDLRRFVFLLVTGLRGRSRADKRSTYAHFLVLVVSRGGLRACRGVVSCSRCSAADAGPVNQAGAYTFTGPVVREPAQDLCPVVAWEPNQQQP